LRSAAAHLAECQLQYEAEIADAVATRHELEQKLAAIEADHLEAEQRALAVEKDLAQEASTRQTVEQKLVATERGRQHADERHRSEVSRAAAQFAERQARHDEELMRAAAVRDALAQELHDTAILLDQARVDRAAEAVAVERLTKREAELCAALDGATATVNTFELRLADADAALEYAERYASAERL